MNRFDDETYYGERAAASRYMARCAIDPAIAAIHAELADRYETMIAEARLTSDHVYDG